MKKVTITLSPSAAEELVRRESLRGDVNIVVEDAEPKVIENPNGYWFNTRLASPTHWTDAQGRKIKLFDMPTSYLLNVRHMILTKPAPTISLIVTDLEDKLDHGHPLSRNNDLIKKSIDRVTSMSLEGLVNLVSSSPLFRSLNEELSSRGVNVSNLETFYDEV